LAPRLLFEFATSLVGRSCRATKYPITPNGRLRLPDRPSKTDKPAAVSAGI
jgi:hypothetical protein